MKKSSWLCGQAAVLAAVFCLFFSSRASAESGFLRVQGTNFISGESAFNFTGVNLDPWRFITADGEVYSRSDISKWVGSAVKSTGAGVIRMHINGGAFEPSAGTYNEEAFKQLDYLVAACAEYKIFCLIALRDYCSSPFPANAYDPYWNLSGGIAKDNILKNPSAIAAFKKFIAYVLNRTNTVTGIVYKNDKSIMGWELINEPDFIYKVIGGWLDNICGYVKSIDPNHLISVGIGAAESQWWKPGAYNWSTVGNLDFIDLHYYAPEALYNPVSPGNAANLKAAVKSGLALNKPVIVGEFGCVTTNSSATMTGLYRTVITAAFSAGASGCLMYGWGPPGPNGYGGPGSYDIYPDTFPGLCSELKSLAPAN